MSTIRRVVSTDITDESSTSSVGANDRNSPALESNRSLTHTPPPISGEVDIIHHVALPLLPLASFPSVSDSTQSPSSRSKQSPKTNDPQPESPSSSSSRTKHSPKKTETSSSSSPNTSPRESGSKKKTKKRSNRSRSFTLNPAAITTGRGRSFSAEETPVKHSLFGKFVEALTPRSRPRGNEGTSSSSSNLTTLPGHPVLPSSSHSGHMGSLSLRPKKTRQVFPTGEHPIVPALSLSEGFSSNALSRQVSFRFPTSEVYERLKVELLPLREFLIGEGDVSPVLQSISNSCQVHKGSESTIARFVSDVFIELQCSTNGGHKERQEALMDLLFTETEAVHFFSALLKNLQHEPIALDLNKETVRLFNGALKRGVPQETLIDIIIQHTQCDLAEQSKANAGEELFRGAWFSSYLCTQYALTFEQGALEHFYGFVSEKLEDARPHYAHLSLDYKFFKENSPHDPVLPKLSEVEKDLYCKNTASANIPAFVEFARPILKELYQIEFSLNFQKLLARRRICIEGFLLSKIPALSTSSSSSSPSPLIPYDLFQKSRIHSGEFPFGRLVCCHLINMMVEPDPRRAILLSLSRMMMQMTNEVEFGVEKPDPVHAHLNPFIRETLPEHRTFMDKCTDRSVLQTP